EFKLQNLSEMEITYRAGIPAEKFASWYEELRGRNVLNKTRTLRMSPWLVRGLRIAIVGHQ
ncbi:MAG: hypothetical protein OXG24_00715, partial [Gammaproteobacteria bacterium]|nr:hypothetical protein [Gammaproteobacteria bacterium]